MNDKKLDVGFGHYIAGFLDGEGCFLIYGKERDRKDLKAVMRVDIRLDDKPLLLEMQEATGLGKVKDRLSPSIISRNATQTLWEVGTIQDCVDLVKLLRRFPLRAKKKRDFEIWSEFVEWWSTRERGSGWDKGMKLWNELKGIRKEHYEPCIK